jgi:hypothetical protein
MMMFGEETPAKVRAAPKRAPEVAVVIMADMVGGALRARRKESRPSRCFARRPVRRILKSVTTLIGSC